MVDKTAMGEVIVFISLVLITASICGAIWIHCIYMLLDTLIWIYTLCCSIWSIPRGIWF
jgi:hypothetical protein